MERVLGGALSIAMMWHSALAVLPETTKLGAAHEPPRQGVHVPMPPRRLQASAVLSSLEVLLSTQRRAPIAWDFAIMKYSLTVPSEAVAAAIVATLDPQYTADVKLHMYKPEDGTREVVTSAKATSFADVPTEEPARFILEIRYGAWAANYTISVLRSTITSSFVFRYPDPAKVVPPQATLTGMFVHDGFGRPVRTQPAFFSPQRSQYVATVDMEMGSIWVVASGNDPEATLELRVDGQDWAPLIAGSNSPVFAVPKRGWLLVEVRVTSPVAVAKGTAPLVYQVVVTRDVVCHERCRTCFGPGEEHCLTCPAPLVLYRGRCETTACPANAYYEWRSYQCRQCHASCAQCDGPGPNECGLCPALHFLAPTRWEDATGPCVIICPAGTFAHPPSRRCRQPPAAPVKAFYMQLSFRVAFKDFQHDRRLQESILNATAFVLGVSLSDVRSYRMNENRGTLQIVIEVVTPFLSRADADQMLIDSWFGAFEVPVDAVQSFAWADMHPPVPPLFPEPLLPSWVLGLITSAITSLLVFIPMYCFYFRRVSNTRKRYATRVGVDPVFIDRVVNQSPAWLIQQFVHAEEAPKK